MHTNFVIIKFIQSFILWFHHALSIDFQVITATMYTNFVIIRFIQSFNLWFHHGLSIDFKVN